MKKHGLFIGALLFSIASWAQSPEPSQPLTIWSDTPNTLHGHSVWKLAPSNEWGTNHKPTYAGSKSTKNPDPEWETQSYPIGNGSIGANIMGSVAAERITFNEKTLWRGGPNTAKGADYYWNVNKQSAHLLPEIRQAFADGDLKKAEQLTRKNFNSVVPYEPYAEAPFRFGNFSTMGEFCIETTLNEVGLSDYQRALSLDSALVTVNFIKDAVHYRREFFTSYPDNVMVVRFTADKAQKQNLIFRYFPNPISTGQFSADGHQGLVYKAHLDNNQMAWTVRIQAIHQGGELINTGDRLEIKNADEVVFLVTADTDYKINFNPNFADPKTYVGVDPNETTSQWMTHAKQLGYKQLLAHHYNDYSTLFNRVQLQLASPEENEELSTAERLRRYRAGKADPYLETLYYQFGRYLLIASSRPGNLPANLQGIWHNNVDGPWRVDYHNNINVQMNYWPSCTTNLPECMLPLIDYIRTLVKPGERTAKAYFGARGWTASISSNIFGFTAPLISEDMSWNLNPMAGPWLATHLWEYYDYTRDHTFLKEVGYDLIRSSARFAIDYLWHKPDGSYTAAPSTSPEHGPIDEGATFVHAVIREILQCAISASETLNVDAKERKEWHHVLAHLKPYQIGRYGQLMEWSTDIDDPKDQHRHVNHLFGLHPGSSISPITTPELSEASRVVLEHRGDGATGWSMGWKLNQWARLQDGNHAYKLYGNLLKNGTVDNLWDTHPPFQIDGNFGGTAGVTEMLLQSHMGFIQLLPALPEAWSKGSVSGLCARGNFEVSMQWENGTLVRATITSHSGGPCQLHYADKTLTLKTVKGKTYTVDAHLNRLP